MARRRPSAPIGAWPCGAGYSFRVWAPAAGTVELVLEGPGQPRTLTLPAGPRGYRSAHVPDLGPGALYRYRLDGRGPFPDPASRSQPFGVHGPSETVDPRGYAWRDTGWRPPAMGRLVLYEVHVGTATPEGTFDALIGKLPHLTGLGVTALELMPVASCPGARNWGYDGVSLYAPAAAYGGPEGLRRLVDAAHAAGLAVLLDVVYNHLGPDGNYLGLYSPSYFTPVPTPWGDAIAFGAGGKPVRDFFVWNAIHWIDEYHADGLRLDATHALADPGRPHIVSELAGRVRRASGRGGRALLIAEDASNDARLVRPVARGGLGLDGVWADDLHHQLHVAATRERDGYYRDYSGTAADVARTLSRGWFYEGQRTRSGARRGTRTGGLPASVFIHCLQNHDQVGNRAMGERLHHLVGLDVWRALSALLLLEPSVPLLFMGQEWASGSPFCYFTDHEPGLGRLVTEGRRREFAHFRQFRAPGSRKRIPDPQAPRTFASSRLDWRRAAVEPHRSVLSLYRDLLELRGRLDDAPARVPLASVTQVGPRAIAFRRKLGSSRLVVVVNLGGALRMNLSSMTRASATGGGRWRLLLSTEETRYGGVPGRLELSAGTRLLLRGAAAAVLRHEQS